MVALTHIATLVAALTSVNPFFDFDIKLTRYQDGDCSIKQATNHMNNNHCYNAGPIYNREPSKSFSYMPSRGYTMSDRGKGCVVKAHSEMHCKGESASLGEASGTFGQCGTYEGAGQAGIMSFSVTCKGHAPDKEEKHIGMEKQD
ncbi:hypothetical protein LTR17_014271 [Elasticomyces elasticus]|nr:hypothetical protein LTR17_014271 [Elasticomyces elasticus]